MDTLAKVVAFSQDFLDNTINDTEYSAHLQELMDKANKKELEAIAHLVCEFAIHLRTARGN